MGDVLTRFGARTGTAGAALSRSWSCDRILGSSSGPCCRMGAGAGERAGVVMRVLTETASEVDGDESCEYTELCDAERACP